MIFKDILECIKLTWDEWHMIVSGWGDGAALSRGERIPTIQETVEEHKDTDFYSILAKEAWYYKFGIGLGRLTWAIIGAIILASLLG